MKTGETYLFHEYLRDLINKSPLKQKVIAEELDYPNPNIIAMFKMGHTRVPFVKVPMLAQILEVDPVLMLRRYLCEYDPLMLKVIEQYFGACITQNEKAIIDEIRRLSHRTDPDLSSLQSRVAVEAFVAELNAVNCR